MILKKLQIVINCLGMPFDSKTLKEKTLGGSETAANCLAIELAKMGNDVKLFTRCQEPEVINYPEGKLSFLPCGDISESKPLGDQFHFYASFTPHDLLIIQRHKNAFHYQYAAKVKFLWLHDLALPRDKKAIIDGTPNLDGVLVVSEYHKKQVCKVYGLPEEFVHALPNGVDLKAFEGLELPELPEQNKGKRLIYISRPERGLEHLLKPGGVMDQLPDYDLYICCYNNVTQQMAPYYEKLWRRAEQMPNVHNLGFLTKEKLYGYMLQMNLMVYPTPATRFDDFREVSCIAVMEAMAAGLPVLTTTKGALPETLKGAGAVFCDDVENYPQHIKNILENDHRPLIEKQLLTATYKTWGDSAKALEAIITQLIEAPKNLQAFGAWIKNNLIHSAVSNLFTPKEFIRDIRESEEHHPYMPVIEKALLDELKECYNFFPESSYSDHYKNYYYYEKDRGVNYGPEKLDGNSRFETVCDLIEKKNFKSNTTILDYGCAHGHYTINLAKRFPNLKFVGVDITHSNVMKARQWVTDENLDNVDFHCGEICQDTTHNYIIWDWHETEKKPSTDEGLYFEHFICAEVLEHVRDPEVIVNKLIEASNALEPMCFITTPFGPWEYQGYNEHWPWRAHIHDFTKPIINYMFSQFDSFSVSCVPNGIHQQTGLPLGSYVYSCRFKPNSQVPTIYKAIEETREQTVALTNYSSLQTLSLCMIVKDDWMTLPKCLDSVKGIVDEVVIRFDESGDNETSKQLVEQFGIQHHVPVKIISGESPLVVGFDAARNETIEACSGDWVLWLDADETLNKAEKLTRFLRNGMYDAFCITQNHFSNDPAGVIKTDYPAKLFRKKSGIKFFGVVHEHPETELNEGTGPIMILPEVSIAHFGYGDEETRRGRFVRNYDLLKKDRELNPNRKLGKFFWLRDMAQYCQFALEEGQPKSSLQWHLEEGFKIWEEILEMDNYRMIMESAKFYTMLVRVSGDGKILVQDNCRIASETGEIDSDIECLFRNGSEAKKYLEVLNDLRLKSYEEQEII